ncbi:MAG: GNAT family N-acetyltransferase [Desulfobacteraceae bacterium]|nr:MAG: GNAT family N-acetyltransferase [Desulfobacteraceae bacterium]
MFFRDIDEDTRIALTIPQYAEELFALVDANRAFLKQWLPWLDKVQTAEDTRSFILNQLERFRRQEALHVTILHQGRIAGVLGYNRIDPESRIGYVGYWLGKTYTGSGIMTHCVSNLIDLGSEYFDLQRMDIRCAVDNVKSRAIPERLGFIQEGVLKNAEKLYDRYVDHVVYGRVTS